MWKNILVPHDFSRCANGALELATSLAQLHGAALLLVHVSPLPPNLPHDAQVKGPDGAMVSVEDMVTAGASRDLAALATPLIAQGIKVATLARATEPGNPATAILRLAGAHGADVIVVGTHGRTGLAHLLMGSVAEKIIRGATMPVITVRGRDEASSLAHAAHGPHRTREERAAEDELVG